MADPTYSVKVTEETRDKVQQLIDATGCSSKEFFEMLLQVYQMEAVKTGSPRHSEDIREVEALLSRINQVICNLATKNDAEILIIQKQQQEKEHEQIEQLVVLEENNNSLLASLKNTEKELEQARESQYNAEKQTQSAVDALAQSNDLANEYRSKIDILTILATKNQTKADQFDQAVTDIAQLNNQLINHSEKMEQLKTNHQRELDQMNSELIRAEAETQKEQTRVTEKIDILEKGFQKERDSFDKERFGFEARIGDIKQLYEREVQLVKENADAKIESSRKRPVKSDTGKERSLAQNGSLNLE